MSDKPIPFVAPCFCCGLPLLREMTPMSDNERDFGWRCNNAVDCIARMGKTIEDPNIRATYRVKLMENPHHAWTYRFNIECLNSNGNIVIADYIDFIGIWQATTFDGIVVDALEMATEYDLPSFRIQNSASEELYAA